MTDRFAALLAYDGARFEGWQRHPGRRTVQGTLEDALAAASGLDEARVEGAGRTDRGAHAEGQVASFDVPGADPADLLNELRAAAPGDLTVRELVRVHAEFHARKDARGKTYRYDLWLRDEGADPAPERRWSVGGPIDVAAMEAALGPLVGTHDFASFATKAGFERASTVRTLRRATLERDGPLVTLRFTADGFLYKMVRSLVRLVLRVGEGKRTPEDVAAILAARDRARSPGSAPASGLTLERVLYDAPLFPGARDEAAP